MRQRSRGSAVALGVLGLGFLAIGMLWALARLERYEIPRWSAPAFVALRETPGAPRAWSERWVVAVHPRCQHCRVSLESLAEARDRTLAEIRVTALIVDAPSAPPESTVARLPADETWWDAAQRWRKRWAHRVYGEVLCFDARGRLLRMLPPIADGAAAREALRAAGFESLFE